MKQCKNKFIIGWLGLLVGRGVFKKILATYLPVGHTHEDIDALFGVIANQIKGRDAVSHLAMAREIRETCKSHVLDAQGNPEPVVVENLDAIANFSEYISPYMLPIHKITRWYQMELKPVETDQGPNAQVRAECESRPAVSVHHATPHACNVARITFLLPSLTTSLLR